MQHHNYKIYSGVKILNDNNIKVYSIKTDALTVHKNDIDKIKSLLNFSTDKIKYYSDLSKEYLQSYNDWFVDKKHHKYYQTRKDKNAWSRENDLRKTYKELSIKYFELSKPSNNIGGWRISKENNINFPSDKLCLMKNQ